MHSVDFIPAMLVAVLARQARVASTEIFTDAAKKLLLVDAALMVALAALSVRLPSRPRPEETSSGSDAASHEDAPAASDYAATP